MKVPNQFIIVDDDESNNFVCESAIRVLFPESSVRLFTDSSKALHSIREERQREYEKKSVVLFLDINMPYLNGWVFLEEFEKLDHKIREQFIIYILSSSIDPYDKDKAASNPGVSGLLSKPLIVKELRQLLLNDSALQG